VVGAAYAGLEASEEAFEGVGMYVAADVDALLVFDASRGAELFADFE